MEEMEENKKLKRNSSTMYLVVLVCLGVGFLIGFFTAVGMGSFSSRSINEIAQDTGKPVSISFSKTFTVSKSDLIRGNKKADVVIFEYSDFQCPFCARFHSTAQEVIKEDKNVAWVYRHLPLPSNALAKPAAVITECIKNNISKEKAWDFADDLFVSSRFKENDLITKAKGIGLTDEQIRSCGEEDSKETRTVFEHLQQAQQFGFNGTPNGVIYNKKENKFENLPGAIPKAQIITLIQNVR